MPKNVYYDRFSSRYETFYGLPYQSRKADFVQLAKLFQGLGEKLTVTAFEQALENYFKSELGNHTLADLAVRFVPFWRGPLDRYGKPKTNGNGFQHIGQSTNWIMKFLRQVNAQSFSDEQRERLFALLDEVEVGRLDEQTAYKQLEAVKDSVEVQQ